MGTWLDKNDYEIKAAAPGAATAFWVGLYERLLAETAPFERVVLETAWDGPRFIAYALELNAERPGYDTGWRMQCFVFSAASWEEAWPAFLSDAARDTAGDALRALRAAHPKLTFWRSNFGEGFEEELPL